MAKVLDFLSDEMALGWFEPQPSSSQPINHSMEVLQVVC